VSSRSKFYNSSGLVIFPAIAEAAAIAGLDRYISDLGCPIRPAKFLFVVAIAFSPSANTPI